MTSRDEELVSKLKLFYSDLKSYKERLEYLNTSTTILGHQVREKNELREKLVREAGKLKTIIIELTGKEYVEQSGRFYDVWSTGLTVDPHARINAYALDGCIDATNEAIGKLESDIKKGFRDKHGSIIRTSQKPDIEAIGISSSRGEENTLFESKTNWGAIEKEFGINKIQFGRKINFVSDSFKREIIFRDVEHSFLLASSGFSKPAVILAGSVIEELLRLYLVYKKVSPMPSSFDGYIKTCEQKDLLKSGISRLSDSVRHFRNLVHLSKETARKYSISKATAVGAVSSIFTIANDF